MTRQRLLLAAASALAFFPCTLQRIPSADLWWLLAQGQWILSHGSLPVREPFSYTAAGLVWYNDQWLAAALFALLYQAGGLALLQMAKSALLCATFALLVESWTMLPVAWLVLQFAGGQFFFDVRAYLFTYLFLVLWWKWLPKPDWKLPVTACLWANLHGGISAGLLVLGASSIYRPQLRRWLLLCGAASLLNPSGIHLHLHPLRLLGSPWGRYLNEWEPAWRHPSLFMPFLLYWAPALVWCALRPERWRRPPLVALGLLSITGWRHQALFCWLSAPQPPDRKLPLRGALLVTFALLVSTLYFAARTDFAEQSLEKRMFPIWGADFLAQNRLGPRLAHPYGWGGYLAFRLAPAYQVAIDGRAAQVYPVEDYLDYLRCAQDGAVLDAWCRAHEVDTVLTFVWEKGEMNCKLLAGRADWKEIYRDSTCVIFTRRAGTWTYPDNPETLCQQALTDLRGPLVDRALALDPHYPKALFLDGTRLLQQGDPRGVERMREALREDPAMTGPHFNLALFYCKTDLARARQEIREEPDSPQKRQLEAELAR